MPNEKIPGAKGIDAIKVDFSVWRRKIDISLTLDVIILHDGGESVTAFCPVMGQKGFSGKTEKEAIDRLRVAIAESTVIPEEEMSHIMGADKVPERENSEDRGE